jgi:hypothetical protein
VHAIVYSESYSLICVNESPPDGHCRGQMTLLARPGDLRGVSDLPRSVGDREVVQVAPQPGKAASRASLRNQVRIHKLGRDRGCPSINQEARRQVQRVQVPVLPSPIRRVCVAHWTCDAAVPPTWLACRPDRGGVTRLRGLPLASVRIATRSGHLDVEGRDIEPLPSRGLQSAHLPPSEVSACSLESHYEPMPDDERQGSSTPRRPCLWGARSLLGL